MPVLFVTDQMFTNLKNVEETKDEKRQGRIVKKDKELLEPQTGILKLFIIMPLWQQYK